MNCPNCKQPANGNYCSHCGARLKWEPLSSLTRYRDIIADDRCRKIIEQETGKTRPGMSANEFLQYAQIVLPTRLPLAVLASISAKAGKKLNLGSENYGFGFYRRPFAHVVLAVLTSLARQSYSIKKVQETEDRCLLEAAIPSGIWNLEGRLQIIIASEEGKSRVFAEAKIFGQWLDWGKTKRLIGNLLKDVETLSAGFEQNKTLN